MENYFNYFTEIEQHFQQRRGGILLLSTLDWALIETWKDAGIPLEAVLRGIDASFDHHEKRPSQRKVNSLAYCAQEVLSAVEEMKEAAVGASSREIGEEKASGFQSQQIIGFLQANAEQVRRVKLPEQPGISAQPVAKETADTLRRLASEMESANSPRLEELERHLTVLEEKLFAVLLAATPDDDVVGLRAEADRELSPYRRKMPAAQIDQLQRQYLHKRLLEKYGLPRLSLFYM